MMSVLVAGEDCTRRATDHAKPGHATLDANAKTVLKHVGHATQPSLVLVLTLLVLVLTLLLLGDIFP